MEIIEDESSTNDPVFNGKDRQNVVGHFEVGLDKKISEILKA